MISWIQRTFQRHFRLVTLVLLVAIIIPFVFIYNPASGIGNEDSAPVRRDFFGYDLSSQTDTSRMMNDAALSVNLQAGFMGFDSEQLQQYALQRVAALRVADQFRLTQPGTDQFTAYLKTLEAFSGADGNFDPVAYASFRSAIKAGGAVSESEISRIIAEDWRIDQVQKLLGGPGYVTDTEIREQLLHADASWTIHVATVDYAAFESTVNPSDAEIERYFQDNTFRYEIPPQVRASYVEIAAADMLDRVELTDAQVRAFYDANPSRFPKPAAATPAANAPAAPNLAGMPPADATAEDFAAVESQVRATMRTERARTLAAQEASRLSLALYEAKVTREGLDAFLASRRLARKPLAPFSQNAAPAELGGSAEIAQEAFRLNATDYFSGAIQTANGGAVLFWEELLPVRQPTLAEVRDKVVADYRDNEKRKRFVELGRTLRTTIETRVKAGTAFEQAVAAATAEVGLKTDSRAIPAFTLRNPPVDLGSPVLSIVDRMGKGEVSDMTVAGDKGYIVYAADRTEPDIVPTSQSFMEAKAGIAASLSRLNANTLLTEIVTAELARTEPR